MYRISLVLITIIVTIYTSIRCKLVHAMSVDSIDDILFVSKDGSFRGYNKCVVTKYATQDSSSLSCVECEGVLRDPVMVQGNNVCTTCSGCNAPLSDLRLITAVNQLRCKCPLETRGCDWSGELSGLIGHLKECGYLMVKCPLGCEIVLSAEEVTDHIDEYCPHKRVECPFNSVGCKVRDLCRGNMAQHMESLLVAHQSLLLGAVSGMRETNLRNRELLVIQSRTIKQHDEMVKQHDEMAKQHDEMVKQHDETIKQHDEMVKQNQENISQQKQIIYENKQTIEQHAKSIVDQRETIFTNRDSILRYDQTIKQQNEKIKQQNEKFEQYDQTIKQQNEKIKQQNEKLEQYDQTIKQQNKTIEQQNKTTNLNKQTIRENEMTVEEEITNFQEQLTALSISIGVVNNNNKKDIQNLSKEFRFITGIVLNKILDNMEWKVNTFSSITSGNNPYFSPISRVGNIRLRAKIIFQRDTDNLNISVERISDGIFAVPIVSIVYWKLVIINSNNQSDLLLEGQNENGIEMKFGNSFSFGHVNRNYLVTNGFIQRDTFMMKLYFAFI